jgi:hypothetical protein
VLLASSRAATQTTTRVDLHIMLAERRGEAMMGSDGIMDSWG